MELSSELLFVDPMRDGVWDKTGFVAVYLSEH
jgi:hypothetical protein